MAVYSTPDFRAAIATDPIEFLREDDFSNQYEMDETFPRRLSERLVEADGESEGCLFIVIQLKEDMGSFPAIDGQCVKIEDHGSKMFVIFDCGDPYTPYPDERTTVINSVLSAIKIEFGITEGLEKPFDSSCYRTDDGRWLIRRRAEGSARLSVLSPLTLEDFATRSKASRILTSRILENLEKGNETGQRQRTPEFGTRLEELIASLQMAPSFDDAYLRLWYLQLWDRLEKFGKACRPRLQVLNDAKLKDEKSHRGAIAHRGVERIDEGLLKSFQEGVFRTVKSTLNEERLDRTEPQNAALKGESHD